MDTNRAVVNVKVATGDFGSWGQISPGPILPGKAILWCVMQRGTEPQPRGRLAKPGDQRGGREKSSHEGGEGHSSLSLPWLGVLLGGTLAHRQPEGYQVWT